MCKHTDYAHFYNKVRQSCVKAQGIRTIVRQSATNASAKACKMHTVTTKCDKIVCRRKEYAHLHNKVSQMRVQTHVKCTLLLQSATNLCADARKIRTIYDKVTQMQV